MNKCHNINISFEEFIKQNNTSPLHIPVMIREVLYYLDLKDSARYLDLTFGAGGYARAAYKSAENISITAFDQDSTVMNYVSSLEKELGTKINFICDNFSNTHKYDIGKFDAIVADLGVSSMQIDQDIRGFSFQKDGPLDMRMSSKITLTAKDVVNSYKEEEIANIIYYYGDEKYSRKIASSIVEYRKNKQIETTLELASIIHKAVDRFYYKSKIDSATKTFQGLRIYINNELDSIETMLQNTLKLLKPNGRLVIVSFHSLEDSIVKKFFTENSDKKVAISKYKERADREKPLEILTKKPIGPKEDEVKYNVRSRSAKLRACRY